MSYTMNWGAAVQLHKNIHHLTYKGFITASARFGYKTSLQDVIQLSCSFVSYGLCHFFYLPVQKISTMFVCLPLYFCKIGTEQVCKNQKCSFDHSWGFCCTLVKIKTKRRLKFILSLSIFQIINQNSAECSVLVVCFFFLRTIEDS